MFDISFEHLTSDTMLKTSTMCFCREYSLPPNLASSLQKPFSNTVKTMKELLLEFTKVLKNMSNRSQNCETCFPWFNCCFSNHVLRSIYKIAGYKESIFAGFQPLGFETKIHKSCRNSCSVVWHLNMQTVSRHLPLCNERKLILHPNIEDYTPLTKYYFSD